MEIKDIVQKIDGLEARAKELAEKASASTDTSEVEGLKAIITNDIQPELAELTRERNEALREAEVKGLKSSIGTLEDALKELRSGFPVGSVEEGKAINPESPYADGSYSFFNDVRNANKGRTQAIERLMKGHSYGEKAMNEEGKALVEGTGSQGGYLVQTQIERQIIDVRELDNVLRPLCSTLNVTTTSIELDQITLGTTAGWVAELATKPESTSLTLATVTANVFTAAGLATISNQLLADSNPAVDALVTRDLAKRLVALEETAFLAGTGTGQPLGILNTPGLRRRRWRFLAPVRLFLVLPEFSTPTLDAIAAVQSLYGTPTGILMHPRTWTAILKDRNANGVYTYGASQAQIIAGPQLQSPRTVYTGPDRTLWGVPVYLSNRIPTNLGAGTNESRIIIGDFSEALILDRQGITVDESPHVYFTSNQTVFRAEERVGFTAARQPNAFCVIGGAGLANT
jgi:HK97 family phage major capsid protein